MQPVPLKSLIQPDWEGTEEQEEDAEEEEEPWCLHIDIAGVGVGADGKGSGFAYIQGTVERVKWVDGLTENEAAYRALLYALRNIPRRKDANIFSDSPLLVGHFNEWREVRNPKLKKLLDSVRKIISERRLPIQLGSPMGKSPARELLNRVRRPAPDG